MILWAKYFSQRDQAKKGLHLFHTNKIHLYKQLIYPNYFYDHANQNLFVPRMPSYLLKLLFALWRLRHRSVGVLQPLFGLGIEGQSRGWRREGVLHHWRWNVYGVRRNWYTFAPSQFHFKIHYHFAWNGQHLANFSMVLWGKAFFKSYLWEQDGQWAKYSWYRPIWYHTI